MLDSEALTKIQTLILIAIIVVVGVIGIGIYAYLGVQNQPSETIRVGVLADLDNMLGRNTWQGVVLAAEQVNSEGGILGRQVEVIGEDNDIESGIDVVKVNSALERLISYHNVDFVIGQVDGEAAFASQEIISQHKKIMFAVTGTMDELTQRVVDNYDKYKYYFKVGVFNATSIFQGMTEGLLLLREQTSFNKLGYLAEDLVWNKGVRDGFDNVLSEVYGFDLVYRGTFPLGTVDFSSYFAAAEAAGTEVLIPLIMVNGGIPFAKEWYDRQSPILVHGGMLFGVNVPESWEWTEGKCEYITAAGFPVYTGYPLTSKTLPTKEAYFNRWGETPLNVGAAAFDIVRVILPDAIGRAQSIASDPVVEALEKTSIETSMAENFVFASSHDMMMGENPNNPEADYVLVMLFQWQNGKQVPVYPKKIMEEAGATLLYPPWEGPWNK